MTSPRAVRFAETVFRWLMHAFPAGFRRAHGLAFFELFRDDARAAYAARGVVGLAALILRSGLDTLMSAPGAWLERTRPRHGTHPTRTTPPTRPIRLTRPAGPTRLFAGFLDDVRVAARGLRKAPGFTAIAVVTLGVGIGANVTIFSLANAVLLRPLASYEPDRVVRISGRWVNGAPVGRFSFLDFADYRAQSTALADLNGANLATLLLAADNRTDQILGEVVSGRYLSMLGARLVAGRALTDADDRAGAPPVAVIGEALWRRRFAQQPVIGRDMRLNTVSYTIVGVAAASFAGSFVGVPVDAWVPIATSGQTLGPGWNTDRSKRTLSLIGRLSPDVTPAQARADLQIVADAIDREFKPSVRLAAIEVSPGTLAAGDQRRLARTFLSLLLGLVALVLMIACANVGNLLVARLLGRRRELAIRIALGASRTRIARMLVAESVLVAGAGGVVAMVLSLWTTRAFTSITPLPTLTLRFHVEPDVRVVGFAVLATVASAVILGIVGAFQAMRPQIAPVLTEESSASIGGRSTMRMRSGLAAIQMTASLLLIVGAGLFVRSARNAESIELGFDPHGVVVLDIEASSRTTADSSRRFYDDLVRRVAALPGVESVATSSRAPLDSSTPMVRVNPREPVAATDDGASITASALVVGVRYFDVVKTPLIAGRTFTDRDLANTLGVVIVNETLAGRLWPGTSAIGRRLWLNPHTSAEPCIVVGVARNSKYLTLGEDPHGHVYLPFSQHSFPDVALLVRSVNPLDRTANQVQATLRALDPNVQGFFTRTLVEHVAVSRLPVRLATWLSLVVASLALALASLGLYALVSFVVAERTSEIGLRMALGADAREVLTLVLGYGVKLAALGLALGLPVALATSRLLGALLYGVSATDPMAFLIAPIIVLSVAVAACYIPARRAMRLDPLTALRHP
jgi:predicted permease